MHTDLASLSPAVLVLLGVLVAVGLTLAITSLVLLARTPRSQLVFDRKWPWVVIILAINLLGPIAFLILARRPAPVTEQPSGTDADVRSTVRSLYG